jgi:hypothetical protein
MIEAPETIWIQTNYIKDCCDLENWDTKPDANEMDYFTGYRREDLAPTLSAAMELPEVRALVEAAIKIRQRCGPMAADGKQFDAAIAQLKEAKP